jgi:hypothetical protein
MVDKHTITVRLTPENVAMWRGFKNKIGRGDLNLLANQTFTRYFLQIREKNLNRFKAEGLDTNVILGGSNGGPD